jgi:hypothetical protein
LTYGVLILITVAIVVALIKNMQKHYGNAEDLKNMVKKRLRRVVGGNENDGP